MSLKSRTRRPPCGWVYRQPETDWSVQKITSGKLITAIADHRVANKLKRTKVKQIWDDVEEHICSVLKGKWALWDFCHTKIPRPQRMTATASEAQAVNPFPVRGNRTKGTTPKAKQVMAEINARKAENATAKKEGRAPRRPCKTCGKRSSS